MGRVTYFPRRRLASASRSVIGRPLGDPYTGKQRKAVYTAPTSPIVSSQLVGDSKGYKLTITVSDTLRFLSLNQGTNQMFGGALWDRMVAVHGDIVDTPGMEEQFKCLLAGGIAGGSVNNPTWDLEVSRGTSRFNNYWAEVTPALIESFESGSSQLGRVCNW